MEITLENKQYTIKYNLRSLMIYEQLTEKEFNPTSLTDHLIYFYSLILANNPEVPYTFDEFIELLDDYPEEFMKYHQFLIKEVLKQKIFPTESGEGDEEKK